MNKKEQLERWAAGENVHDKETGECCPDFACCQPHNHFSPELRAKFLQMYREGGLNACIPLMMMGLQGMMAGKGVNIYIAGDFQSSGKSYQ